MWNLSWQVCILLSHFTVWLSPRDKDQVVWRSFSLDFVIDNGDKLWSSCIKERCSILHESRGTDGSLWCTAVALHVLVWTVLEAVVSKELLTRHASTDVGNSVHTLLSVSHCKTAPYNNMKEIVLAMSHYFWWSTWIYVLISYTICQMVCILIESHSELKICNYYKLSSCTRYSQYDKLRFHGTLQWNCYLACFIVRVLCLKFALSPYYQILHK